jgi:regulator of protease activity HflC (stomatin/prohibitin superfamily)
MSSGFLLFAFIVVAICFITIVRTAIVVPEESAYVVERLGKYHQTLTAGFHLLTPTVDKVRFKYSLKEVVFDVPEHSCVSKDNVKFMLDASVCFKIVNAEKASYAVADVNAAVTQLAQSTARRVLGTFNRSQIASEQASISSQVVEAMGKGSEPWGVAVSRYEIKEFTDS